MISRVALHWRRFLGCRFAWDVGLLDVLLQTLIEHPLHLFEFSLTSLGIWSSRIAMLMADC